ncbi:hypothetical protein FRC08_000882 [Ceratobasidium sp. 394]|nr:hypothetical protein FRC08_000882 [Ceratobasidium sp. 394]
MPGPFDSNRKLVPYTRPMRPKSSRIDSLVKTPLFGLDQPRSDVSSILLNFDVDTYAAIFVFILDIAHVVLDATELVLAVFIWALGAVFGPVDATHA